MAFETSRGRDLSALVRRQGAEAIIAPALRQMPAGDRKAVFSFAEALLAGNVDAAVFFTGSGFEAFLDTVGPRFERKDIVKALKGLTLIARGHRAVQSLRSVGLRSEILPSEPVTSVAILKAIDDKKISLAGKRVAVQESGVPNVAFLTALESRGAQVLRVPVYRWALPKDTRPLRNAVRQVAAGRVDILLFTNGFQAGHLHQTAQEMGLSDVFSRALSGTVVASIGPHCSERLKELGWPVDIEPSLPALESLVSETAARAPAVLSRKRSSKSITMKDRAAHVEPAADRLAGSLFMRACRREKTERTPIWLMRQAGRYMKNYRDLRAKVSMLELCKHPDLVAEVTVDAVKRLGVDAAIIFSDLLLIVEPLGLDLEYAKGEGPLIRPPVRTVADVKKLRPVDVDESLGYVLESLRKTRAALPPDIPLLGFSGAPFTLASYLIEGEGSRNYIRTKSFMYNEPAAWDLLLTKISKCLADFLNKQAEAGAQAVQVFDSWVGCLSPEDYRRFALPYSRRVIQGVKKVPVIHFGTGTGELLGLMKQAGGDVIGLDWRVELDRAWKKLGDVAVMGNFDPVALFSNPTEIRRQAKRILGQAAGRPGHIFNLGHGILPETPMDNVLALVESVKELSARR